MNHKSILSTIGIAASLMMAGAVSSCNKDSDSTENVATYNLAVTSFKLKADAKNTGLDSAYFAIDLQHGIIFNADSLRKGTKIDKVVADITFSSVVSEAVIEMSGGTTRQGEIDYQANPGDSIDFTGDVFLRVKADNNNISARYRLKVNVHTVEADKMTWDEMAKATLPSRLANPKRQKTVKIGDNTVSLIEENDGTYTVAECDDIAAYSWSKRAVTLPFTPDIRSLTTTDDTLWILDTAGHLHTSSTGWTNWTDTGEQWISMIGSYTNSVVGLKTENGLTVFAQYPLTDLNVKAIPDDFPVSGTSDFVTLANKWTSSPVAFFTGGRGADGNLSDVTWAFDGSEWIRLSRGGVPPIEGASVIAYYNYRPSATGNSMIEYEVWMLMGGRMTDGTFNRTVYISYDNGVNWATGKESLQLPDAVPAMTEFDNIVAGHKMSANLSQAWTRMSPGPKRIKYTVNGDEITWSCPYIYLFGGFAPDGTLYNTVWHGVLNRLTFTPII